jgi:serine/threonine-protein kinase HipA
MNPAQAAMDEARPQVTGRRGVVRLDGRRVGAIQETDTGSRFTYDAEWLALPDAIPVSLTLPLRPEPYESRGLLPFFENLLPEGWLLELSTAKLKIPKDDAFGLLLATCADCVGAVEVIAEQDRQA